jgi:hypothetical protein
MPLLSHKNPEIRPMAADAFAYAMGMHPDSSAKAILRFCATYIEWLPKVTESKVKTMASTATTIPLLRSIAVTRCKCALAL